jgi:ribonuclease E
MLETELDDREFDDKAGGSNSGELRAGAAGGGPSVHGPADPVKPNVGGGPPAGEAPGQARQDSAPSGGRSTAAVPAVSFQPPQVLFQPPAVAPAEAAGPAPAAGAAPGTVQEPESDSDGGRRGTSRRRNAGRGKSAAEGSAPPVKQGGSDGGPGGPGGRAGPAEAGQQLAVPPGDGETVPQDDEADDGADDGSQQGRRRRRRGGRSRTRARGGNSGPDEIGAEAADDESGGEAAHGAGTRSARRGGGQVTGAVAADAANAQADTGESDSAGQDGADRYDADRDGAGDEDDSEADGTGQGRRRRRKRRRGSGADVERAAADDDPPDTVVHVRQPRATVTQPADDVRAVKGSTRLEAKRQRRREGRESGRRRPPVITEAEFLARREAVERTMVVRQRGDRTQIAVLEDGILVEHYVNRASHQSYVGNVYLGKVQNVLPSMEAAFVDIGKGRNAVLYAGEVNFDASGLEGQPKRIESALKSGQPILVQVTKDPVGHKGARLTSQVSLPGRYLVYVPGASMTGISRKLPDTERTRLKKILKKVMPEDAGVIVRTAAEGATEDELARDVARLAAQWENIEQKTRTANAPELLYGEPDLTIRVIRDVFNEDFSQLIVAGDDGWAEVEEYVRYVAPHLADRVTRWEDDGSRDAFAEYRIDEQLAKALERKVWLPSGGSLVIDRTEAMTVIDVNTGKFTGQGGNLEETVTRNNLEAAEEIVRQLRLRDVGGIVVIDFIDMVLESNRELVLRRLLECLSRDRTKHQVAEVTSLGLVQMTRKRVGAGLLEAFSVPCECCNGRGVHVSLDLAELGQPGQGCQQGNRAQPGGHARGSRHDGRHADESSSRPGKRNGDNSDAGKDRNGDSGRSDYAGKGRNGESRPNGGGRKGRNGGGKWHADSGAAAVAHDAADVSPADAPVDVSPADGPVDVSPADAPAGHSQNGAAPYAADVMYAAAPGDESEARSPQRAPEPGSGPETAAPSAPEAAPWPEAPMQAP